MEEVYAWFVDFVRRPAVAELAIDAVLCVVPIWLAVMIGLFIGWSWRPRWTGLVFLGLRSKLRFAWTAPPGFGARRLWLAFTAFSVFSVCQRLWSNFKGKSSGGRGGVTDEGGPQSVSRSVETSGGSSSGNFEIEHEIVTEKDLEHLIQLLDGKIGDAAWQHQMEHTTSNMLYQAWRYEPEDGPIVYKSRTIFEDATPELVKDFFWDDEFRLKWDAMLAYSKILEEFSENGTMIVHWIKKFPFFCSDREYIIGRRIWEDGKTFYCVTKGVPYPSLPQRERPRRVELYFSSWLIRAVESRKKDGLLSACEVTLIHYEDMGIPKDVAKLGVRHGMWGAVKRLQSGMRAYQLTHKAESCNGSPISRCALLAQSTTKMPPKVTVTGLNQDTSASRGEEGVGTVNGERKEVEHRGGIDWRLIAIGGTVAVVCGLHSGLIGKVLFFGAARRLANK
ncbi:hypothetical protein LUZ63_015969 [Rhynchospora breviuscula]|uniref:START domain-containing protein n=1 Tax=Rhynchospora breviuscula TaxID=2022672 RepID=A0A9Q0HMW1_9POAL|nr:hypothetical protein LUZ63_015969 [Rhynchospora breviuscula]